MTQLIVEPRTTDSSTGDTDICHYYCCEPDVAYCGLEISEHIDVDQEVPDDEMCVVCLDILYSPIGDDEHAYTCRNFGT